MEENLNVFDLIEQGNEPVSISRQTRLNGKDLKELLIAKGILHKKTDSSGLKEPIGCFLKDGPIMVDAFYFTTNGPLLMMFEIHAQGPRGKELIAMLTGDKELAGLFGVASATARILRCSKGSFETLLGYVAELCAKKTDV